MQPFKKYGVKRRNQSGIYSNKNNPTILLRRKGKPGTGLEKDLKSRRKDLEARARAERCRCSWSTNYYALGMSYNREGKSEAKKNSEGFYN